MKKTAFIYICLAGILWGTSGIFVHYLTPLGLSTVQLSAIRGTVSFIAMAIFALIKDKTLFKRSPKEIIAFFFVGLTLFLTATLYYTSMTMTSVSTAVVLMYTAPVYVTVFSVARLGERLTPMKAISIVAMLVGCCFVSGLIGGLKFNLIGILLGIGSGVTYAAYNILTKVTIEKGSPAESVTVYGFLFMMVIALLVSQPQKIVSVAISDPLPALPLMIGLGIFTFVLPYFLYTLSMRSLPAGTASALGIIEPMAATLFSVILFDEALDVFAIIGIVLILAATVALALCDEVGGKKSECPSSGKEDKEA